MRASEQALENLAAHDLPRLLEFYRSGVRNLSIPFLDWNAPSVDAFGDLWGMPPLCEYRYTREEVARVIERHAVAREDYELAAEVCGRLVNR
jgi:hypothetical protein